MTLPPIKPIEWTEPAPPNENIRYDHVIGTCGLGKFVITWKSWKKFDSYCLDFNDDYLVAEIDLEAAKEYAFTYLSDKIHSCFNLTN